MIRFMRELFSQFRHKIRPVDEKQIIAQWSNLHENGYHPGVKEIVERIQTSRTSEKSGWIELFEKNGLLVPELSGKVFGEIGHGGGWYLAEALDAGAKKAIGWEINANLNSRASNALHEAGCQGFSLELVHSNFDGLERLPEVDVLLSITVFQHIQPDYAEQYLRRIRRLLRPDARFFLQLLQHHGKTTVRRSSADVFSVRYDPEDALTLFQITGFKVVSMARHDYGKTSHWGLYILSPSSS